MYAVSQTLKLKRTRPAVRGRCHKTIFFKVFCRNGESQVVTDQHVPQPPIPQEEVTEKGSVDCSPRGPPRKKTQQTHQA